MYAIAIIRYRKPFEEVQKVLEDHRVYLRGLKERRLLLASGPLEPRHGGALLLRVPDEAVHQTLEAIRDHDPYVQQGVAQYELLPWNPGIGREDLDKL